MYKIIERQNYRGEKIYILLVDNEIINSSISTKNINNLISKNIDFNDSEAIKKFIKIYNL